jgi:hypothetical protein
MDFSERDHVVPVTFPQAFIDWLGSAATSLGPKPAAGRAATGLDQRRQSSRSSPRLLGGRAARWASPQVSDSSGAAMATELAVSMAVNSIARLA